MKQEVRSPLQQEISKRMATSPGQMKKYQNYASYITSQLSEKSFHKKVVSPGKQQQQVKKMMQSPKRQEEVGKKASSKSPVFVASGKKKSSEKREVWVKGPVRNSIGHKKVNLSSKKLDLSDNQVQKQEKQSKQVNSFYLKKEKSGSGIWKSQARVLSNLTNTSV